MRTQLTPFRSDVSKRGPSLPVATGAVQSASPSSDAVRPDILRQTSFRHVLETGSLKSHVLVPPSDPLSLPSTSCAVLIAMWRPGS